MTPTRPSGPNAPSLLGERQIKIPIAGRIRSGIKRLARSFQHHAQALSIYQHGMEAGDSYQEIELRIQQACGPSEQVLVPQNVDYFSVRRCDFVMPEVAERILSLYAEDRGDGPRLYRLPIIFAMDDWQSNMPHALKCHHHSGLKYWSEYDAKGVRYCKQRGQVEIDERNHRAKRTLGGRPVELREDNNGRCIPEDCPEYQNRQCTLSGSLIFYIPGVPGSSAIELPTGSFYSMDQMRQKMETVHFLRGGKISGTLNGKPIFWLTKKFDTVSMLNEEDGKPLKVRQHLAVLEDDLAIEHVFAESDPSDTEQAARFLDLPHPNREARHEY